MVEAWNSRVTDRDDVYMLGDVVWTGKVKEAQRMLSRLNGKKHLVAGNHDGVLLDNVGSLPLFEVENYRELRIGEKLVVLSHYPIPFWKGQFYKSFHFYGHVHNSAQNNMMDKLMADCEACYAMDFNCINVGAMMPWMDYAPRSFEELKETIAKKPRKQKKGEIIWAICT